jgi:hypothetical protein
VEDELPPVLSIGSIAGGGPNDANWLPVLMAESRRIARLRQGVSSPLSVNVVFQIEGDLLAPDFQGIRTGYYSRAMNLLMVQVALTGEPPADPVTHVRQLIGAAVSAAEAWARRRRIVPDLSSLQALVRAAE